MEALAIPVLPTIQALAKLDGWAVDTWAADLSLAVQYEDDIGKLYSFVQAANAAEATARLFKTTESLRAAELHLAKLRTYAEWKCGSKLLELDAGGKGKPKSERREAAEAAGIKPVAARELQKLAKIEESAAAEIVERMEASGQRPTVGGVLRIAGSASGQDGYDGDAWYTPVEFAEATRRVFGQRPDADPASCAVGQKTIGAKRFWTAAPLELGGNEIAAGLTESTLGLIRESWGGVGTIISGRISHADQIIGKVFCNPPYSFPAPFLRAIIEGWIGCTLEEAAEAYAAEQETTPEKLDADPRRAKVWRTEAIGERSILGASPMAKIAVRRVTEAIVLVNVATASKIQQAMMAVSSARCFVAGRIAFLDPRGVPHGQNRYDQVIFYIGDNPQKFAAEFSRFGEVKT